MCVGEGKMVGREILVLIASDCLRRRIEALRQILVGRRGVIRLNLSDLTRLMALRFLDCR